MSLIDQSYFVGDIALPNLDEVSNTIQDTIDRYEEECLKNLLGHQLYEAFILGLEEPSPDQEWIDLRDGKEFTFEVDGHTVTEKWNGLINNDRVSLISYYVYYKYRYENLSTTTSINDVQGIAENATKVNDTRKMVYAWNRGIELSGSITPWEDYFYKYDDTYEFFNDLPSAYNFLNANRGDYPNWVFTPLLRYNEFGI